MRAWLLLLTVGLWLVSPPPPAGAQTTNAAKTFGPFTLNSENYAPDTTGVPISEYDDHCTVQLVLASGTISVNVEAGLTGGGGFVSTGSLTGSAITSLEGPLDVVRFYVTACTDCLATATLRCRSSSP